MFAEPFANAHDALADAQASARLALHKDIWRYRELASGVQPVGVLQDGVKANIDKINRILTLLRPAKAIFGMDYPEDSSHANDSPGG